MCDTLPPSLPLALSLFLPLSPSPFLSWFVLCTLCYRDELGWDSDESVIYFNQFDPDDANRENHTVSLYTQRYPYGQETQVEFDPNLGRHEGFLLLGPYIFAQKTEDNEDAHLLVSYNRQPFKAAQIPTPYDHRNYIVSHIEERQALVIVEHEGDFYNLYLSDETGVYYSLSLRDIVINNAIDLERVSRFIW